MEAAPVNQMGVVCLFAEWARTHGVRIESIQPDHPNCIAWVKTGGQEKEVRIAFEYASRDFRSRWRKRKRCDWIVCWEHNWPDHPDQVDVIELRSEHGLGFNVWVQPVSDDAPARFSSQLSRVRKRCKWSIASGAHQGDLVLFYHSTPRKEIADVFRVSGPVEPERAPNGAFVWNARTRDYFANLTRVAKLSSPVTLEHLKGHPALMDAGWIRNNLISRARVTVDWRFLRDLITERNPGLERDLPRIDGISTQKQRRRSAKR